VLWEGFGVLGLWDVGFLGCWGFGGNWGFWGILLGRNLGFGSEFGFRKTEIALGISVLGKEKSILGKSKSEKNISQK
jgi:hypothetical protein